MRPDFSTKFAFTKSFISAVVGHIAFESTDGPEGDKVKQAQNNADFETIEGQGNSDGTGVPDTGSWGSASHLVFVLEYGTAADEADSGNDPLFKF